MCIYKKGVNLREIKCNFSIFFALKDIFGINVFAYLVVSSWSINKSHKVQIKEKCVITFSPHELSTFAQSPHKLPTRPK
jgi:hypothetical protein